jgi:hypothetical protein
LKCHAVPNSRSRGTPSSAPNVFADPYRFFRFIEFLQGADDGEALTKARIFPRRVGSPRNARPKSSPTPCHAYQSDGSALSVRPCRHPRYALDKGQCPLNGRDSTLWKTVEAGRLPEHYQVQVQHQLMVTKAAVADVFVFDGANGILLEVAPDAGSWPRIHEAWDAFIRRVMEERATATDRP